jgi:hypothetical protein
VFTEHEALVYAHHVLFVVRIMLFELLKKRGLNQTLLVQSFFVAKNLQRDQFLVFVIETPIDLSERAFADALLHFEPIRNMVMNLADVLTMVVIETIVLGTGGGRHLSLSLLDG